MRYGYLALAILASLMGAATYRLIGTARSQDVFVLLAMGVLTAWFILGDINIDHLFERDKARAEHEAKQWR